MKDGTVTSEYSTKGHIAFFHEPFDCMIEESTSVKARSVDAAGL